MCGAGAMLSTCLFCCQGHEAYSCVLQEPCGLLFYFAARVMRQLMCGAGAMQSTSLFTLQES
jgi:hypothetical protein